jgi:hypothetical protein
MNSWNGSSNPKTKIRRPGIGQQLSLWKRYAAPEVHLVDWNTHNICFVLFCFVLFWLFNAACWRSWKPSGCFDPHKFPSFFIHSSRWLVHSSVVSSWRCLCVGALRGDADICWCNASSHAQESSSQFDALLWWILRLYLIFFHFQNLANDLNYLADLARELLNVVAADGDNGQEVEPFDAKTLLHHPIACLFWTNHFGRTTYEVSWADFRRYLFPAWIGNCCLDDCHILCFWCIQCVYANLQRWATWGPTNL